MSIRAYYSARVSDFLREDTERILGVLATHHAHALEEQQRSAWLQQIPILKQALCRQGAARIYLEFYIPRMGKRVDVALIAENIIFLLEFKVRAEKYEASDLRRLRIMRWISRTFMRAAIMFRSFRCWYRRTLPQETLRSGLQTIWWRGQS